MCARPRKPRHCCCPALARGRLVWKVAGQPLGRSEIFTLTHDELEALSLCDRLGATQEEAGRRMGVSRGTVQRLLAGGRKKVAEALSSGGALALEPETEGKE